MNSRIRPDDLKSTPYKELILHLIDQWGNAGLVAQELTKEDHQTAISVLLLTTQNPDRTRTIVEAVLAQAIELGRTSVWVEQELKYEGMIEGADRADFLRFELAQAPSLNDTLLDQYNERMSRFAPNGQYQLG
jgi:hypothetical protein